MYPWISPSVATEGNHFPVDLGAACVDFASLMEVAHFCFLPAALDDHSWRRARFPFSLLVLAIGGEEVGARQRDEVGTTMHQGVWK